MESVDELAEIYKAFSDPTRLRIITILAGPKNSLCVNALTNKIKVSQSAVSQHLRILRHVGLVTSRRMGPHVHYSLNYEILKKIQLNIHMLIKKQHEG